MIDSLDCPQGKLATALRWRALTYKVVHERSGHNALAKELKQRQLLEGMKEIICFADVNANSKATVVFDNFPREEHVKSLFDVAKRDTYRIHDRNIRRTRCEA